MFESKAYRNATYLAIGILLCVYAYWIFQARTGLLPIWSDEFCYYANARSFTENTTIRAAYTYTGKGSLLFQADGHGFAYPLLHGFIGKLIGFHSLNLPLTNIAFMLLSLLLVICQKGLNHSQKATITLILFTFLTVPLYSFTFMQESFHLLIAVVCTVLMLSIYEKRRRRDIVIFLLIIGIASLFRNLWLFWSIGLIPLALNRKQLFQYISLFIFCAVLSFLFARLFWDSFPSYFSSVTNLIGQGLFSEAAKSLYNHCISNIESYFTGELSKPYPYFPTKLIIFFSVVTMATLYQISKEKVYLAATLIGIVNFALLLITFDAWDWREIRSMSPLFYMFTIIIVSKKHVYVTIACLVFTITSFPHVRNLTSKFLLERNQQAVNFKNTAFLSAPPQQLATILDSASHPLVLLGYIPQDYTQDLLLLPLRTSSGKPIRYAINYFNERINFADYNFVLVRNDLPVAERHFRRIMNAGYFTLYHPITNGTQ